MPLEFIQTNSVVIQALSTIALLGITAFYVYYTHKLAKTTQEMFEAERRPYLDLIHPRISNVSYNKEDQIVTFQAGVQLRNVGKVLLKYNVVKFDVTINGNTKSNEIKENIINKGAYIFPDKTGFYSEGIFQDVKFPAKAIMDYTITYSAEENLKNYHTEKKILYTIYCIKDKENDENITIKTSDWLVLSTSV